MSKVILILNKMPNSCKECMLVDNREFYSPITERWESWHCRRNCNPINIESNIRPDWCPLAPLPETYAPIDCEGLYEIDEYYINGLVDGWNACIDEIQGENNG